VRLCVLLHAAALTVESSKSDVLNSLIGTPLISGGQLYLPLVTTDLSNDMTSDWISFPYRIRHTPDQTEPRIFIDISPFADAIEILKDRKYGRRIVVHSLQAPSSDNMTAPRSEAVDGDQFEALVVGLTPSMQVSLNIFEDDTYELPYDARGTVGVKWLVSVGSNPQHQPPSNSF
jgi:hypothetical protein